MSDETIEIPVVLQDRFEAAVKEAYKEHEKEFRRSLKISTSFYEKLLALNAGSIAVAASIGIALIAKPELRSGSLHAIAHWLVVITIFLFVSLVCAVVHNFVVVGIAKSESAYSEDEFVRTIVREALAMVRVTDSAEIQFLDRLKEKAQEKLILQQQHIVKRRQFLHPCATALGYISMGSFLAAYTLVVVFVVRLWCITR
jgi:uncharacterized membrane protein